MNDNVIDARTFKPKGRAKPSGCRQCGRSLESGLQQSQKRHCSKTCSKKAYKLRKEGQILDYQPGVCPVCGTEFDPEPPPSSISAFCSRNCRNRWDGRTRAFAAFRSRVEWPQPLSWLAKKLSKKGTISPDDPRLAAVALALAEKGELVVYVGKDGTVGSVGLPKRRKEAQKAA